MHRLRSAVLPLVAVLVAVAVMAAMSVAPHPAFGQIARPTANPTFASVTTTGTSTASTFISTGGTGNGLGLNSTSANTFGMTYSGTTLILRGNGSHAAVYQGDGTVWFLQCDYTGCVSPEFVSNAGSGSNGFAFTTDGARLDLGTGADDYLYSDGTRIHTSNGIIAQTGGFWVSGSTTAGIIGSGANLLAQFPAAGSWIIEDSSSGDDQLRVNTSEVRAVTGYLAFDKNGAGAPTAADCDADAERGRFYIDTSNNRLYICNGGTRLWDYVALTD